MMKLSSETLQNLPYFWNMKTPIVFFILSNFGVLTVDVLNYVDIDQGVQSTVTNPKLLKPKNKKKLFWISYSKNMANFETFR